MIKLEAENRIFSISKYAMNSNNAESQVEYILISEFIIVLFTQNMFPVICYHRPHIFRIIHFYYAMFLCSVLCMCSSIQHMIWQRRASSGSGESCVFTLTGSSDMEYKMADSFSPLSLHCWHDRAISWQHV